MASSVVFYWYVDRHVKNEDNKLWKYVIAGTVSTIAVELSTHFLDTLNIRSKVKDTQKVPSFVVDRKQGKFYNELKRLRMQWSIAFLFRGYQAVFWGYLPSSIIYFYIYGRFKDKYRDA